MQQTSFQMTYIRTNQHNIDNPQTMAPTIKNHSRLFFFCISRNRNTHLKPQEESYFLKQFFFYLLEFFHVDI